MDPITQGALGAALPQAFASPDKLRRASILGCLAGMAPDLDILIGAQADPLLFLEYHRQFTHSLLFVPVGAALVALLAHPIARGVLRWRESYCACLLGYATHGVLDVCTTYGTQWFWPFSDYRVAWNSISVADPLFTLPLAGCVVLAAALRRPWLARLGLVWAFVYLLFGAAQGQRAVAAGVALAKMRGHEPARLSAKPAFGNVLLWKIVYAHDGRYYVNAVRAGWRVAVCGGESVPTLDIARDLPWLAADTQQARDVERFRWFSQGFVAPHPRLPNHVIDVRYSMVPNQIQPLWGIALDPAAGALEHVRFVADRRASAAQGAAYFALLRGDDCVGVEVVKAATVMCGPGKARLSYANTTTPGGVTYAEGAKGKGVLVQGKSVVVEEVNIECTGGGNGGD